MRIRSISSVLLLLVAILYWAVQWKYAARIGPNTIFLSSRKIQRADFADMVDELSKVAQRVCNTNRSYKFLFDDEDVALSYMKISHDRLNGCVTIRETNVTLFSGPEIDDCNAVFVREHLPSDEWGLRMNDDFHTNPWIETERWISSDGKYGFALYRHPCLADKTDDLIHHE